MRKRKTRDHWINRALEIHGDSYDYSEFYPESVKSKSRVTCNFTGESWMITPDNLVNNKRGCPCCKGRRISESKTMPYEQALSRLQSKHPHITIVEDTYNGFSKTCEMICEEHGLFCSDPEQVYSSPHGCIQCVEDTGYNRHRPMSQDEFLDKALKLKPNLDFSESVYKSLNEKINYRCKKHPDELLSARAGNVLYHYKYGCDICAKESAKENLTGWYTVSNIERNKEYFLGKTSYLYLMQLDNTDIYKIGLSYNPKKRLKEIRKTYENFKIVHTVKNVVYNCFYAEKDLHDKYRECRYKELDYFKGHTEIFKLSEKDIEDIIKDMESLE